MSVSANSRVARRTVLRGAFTSALCFAAPARAASFTIEEVAIPSAPRKLQRALVMRPEPSAGSSALPVLILLHGLGETRAPELGLRAWCDAYGLCAAWQTLNAATPLAQKPRYLTDAEWDALRARLASEPFRGFCVVCPFMPNPSESKTPGFAFAHYATYVVEQLLPAVRSGLPGLADERATGICGVSLGGIAAVEVFLRAPGAFATVASLQGAFSEGATGGLSRRIAAAAGGRRLYFESSSFDPYRKANELLMRRLREKGVPVDWQLRAGPHSQTWLREIGSLDLLLWHDRALRGGRAARDSSLK